MFGNRTTLAVARAAMAVALLLLASPIPPANAAPFETKAQQAVLMDAASGAILYEKNGDELMHPASMSKLMTLAVLFRALKEGRVSLSDTFTASEHAWRTGGAPSGTSAMFVPINQPVTVEELIPGITVQSGNDACIIVAEGLAGSEPAFVAMMNSYAREIGLTKSHFANSTGLTNPEHKMTARELAVLARHILQTYPEYYHYFSIKEFRYRKHVFYNRNPLVFDEIGVDGLKTGYVSAAGYGIVLSAEREGQRLIAVLNGMKDKNEREEEGRRILDYGFNNFKLYTLFRKGETVGDALVWGGTQHFLPLVGGDGVHILLPKAAERHVRAHIIYKGPLKPPIRKGDQVAILRITAAEIGASNEVPLYAAQDVGEGSIWVKGFDSLLHLAFGWIL